MYIHVNVSENLVTTDRSMINYVFTKGIMDNFDCVHKQLNMSHECC